MKDFKDYYELLGVSRTASTDEIKHAFRQMTRKYHPDLTGEDEALKAERTRMQQKLNEAWEVLKDEEKRKEYDWNLASQERRQQEEERARQQRQEQQRQAQERARQQQEQQRQAQERARQQQEQQRQSRSGQNGYRYSQDNWDNRGYTNSSTTWQNYYSTPKNDTKSESEPEKSTLDKIIDSLKSRAKKTASDYSTAYKKVKKEEKDYSFTQRHRDIEEHTLDPQDEDKPIKKFTIHFVIEFLHQLAKLKVRKDDTFPIYTVRNRRTLTGILATALMLGILGGPKNPEQPTDDGRPAIVQTDPTYSSEESESITLTRVYTVESGDTLSQLSADSNTTQSYIMEVNGLKNADLQIGQVLNIPYIVDEDELKYCTKTVSYNEGMTLEDYAKKYETDTATLLKLNAEAFMQLTPDDDYHFAASELVVPTFPTKAEMEAKKANANQH